MKVKRNNSTNTYYYMINLAASKSVLLGIYMTVTVLFLAFST